MNASDEMKIARAAAQAADTLAEIATSIEGIAVALQGIDSAGVEHRHTWVFLRQDVYQRHITKERTREVLPGKLAEDMITFGHNRYYEVSDFYYCAGCPEMRRVHMEDYFHSTGTLDGRPHIRFWVKEIPE